VVQVSEGFLSADCDGEIDVQRLQYLTQTIFKDGWARATSDECAHVVRGTTLAVTRYEYANLYHGMTDFVNAYLAAEILELDPRETTVLIMDGHPWSPMDELWGRVLAPSRGMVRVASLRGLVCFERLVFVNTGYQSPLATQWGTPNACFDAPLVRAFASRVLASFGLLEPPPEPPKRPTITFIFRRDYVAHPREKGGGVRRHKIDNENELLELARSGDDVEVRAIDMAALPFDEQLRAIRGTNVLVGMHGAGLTHTLFLPREAVLLEMFPIHAHHKKHFRNIARWMGHPYLAWKNKVQSLEISKHVTHVDVKTFEPVLDAAVRIARNFGTRNEENCGLRCPPETA
jgi:hypothetical protein